MVRWSSLWIDEAQRTMSQIFLQHYVISWAKLGLIVAQRGVNRIGESCLMRPAGNIFRRVDSSTCLLNSPPMNKQTTSFIWVGNYKSISLLYTLYSLEYLITAGFLYCQKALAEVDSDVTWMEGDQSMFHRCLDRDPRVSIFEVLYITLLYSHLFLELSNYFGNFHI